MPRLLFLTLALLCWSNSPLHADDVPRKDLLAAKKTVGGAWTVDDAILGQTASNWHISPEGQWAVWVKSSPDKEKNLFISHLMLSNLANGQSLQLTRGKESCTHPRWSPDGKQIAFLSSRPAPRSKNARDDEEDKADPKMRIWLMNAFGGEPWVLTESPRDVRDLAWMDTDTIIYLAQEKTTHREKKLKEDKDTVQVVEDEAHEPPVRLWRFAIKDKKTTRLTDNKDRIQSLFVSPNGRYAVTIHERSLSYTFDQKVKPVVYLHDLKEGQQRQIFQGKQFNIATIHWQPDSQRFYAVNRFTTSQRFLYAWVHELYESDLQGRVVQVDLQWKRGLADDSNAFAVLPDGFVALLANGVRHKLARYRRTGAGWQRDWRADPNLYTVLASRDGKRLICQESSARTPPRWLHVNLDRPIGDIFKKPLVLADLQAELRDRPRARVETISWKGACEEAVEGLLYYPHNWKEGKKYPLVVMIHGGPFAADLDQWDESWAYTPNLICQRGAFVLKPNYHGSSNYGLAFAESIKDGKYYEYPLADIERGIDHLVSRGLVAEKKVGLSGWSNGAILTMALITRRHYQAACAGAGGSEWVSDWGTCEFGLSFDNYYFGKSPLEDPDLYRKMAPFFDFPKVRTPVILFQGTDDRVVPVHHGWMQFRGLQQLGQTQVRFLLFPGEKHSLTKITHQKRKVEEELAWFDRHLFQSLQVANPALKVDSPLARALALKDVARAGRLYGIQTREGWLIPETVEYQGLRLGRFEVTRAQYAAFDPTYKVEPGTENYPANGISFEKAKEYCAWLSKQTGRVYRLGTLQELQAIYAEADGPENILDYWAGYEVNPEDRERLLAEIRQLPGKAPLLREVGSFKPLSSKALLYDLGGNVAEWVTGEKGAGVIRGGSADRTADERDSLRGRPAPEYVGFRVVQETGGKEAEK